MDLNDGWDSRLYQNISDENPAGAYLRFNTSFDTFKESRTEIIQSLVEKGYDKALLNRVESLYGELVDVLENQSKDFLIALWLVELLILKDNLQGLRRGIEFLERFLSAFWEVSHPQEEDCDQKLSMMQWFDNAAAKLLTFTKTIQNTSLIDKYYSVADLVKLNDLTLKWSSKEIKFLKTDERKLYSEFMELQSDYFAFLDTLETNVLENDIENVIYIQNMLSTIDEKICLLSEQDAFIFPRTKSSLVTIEGLLKDALKQIQSSLNVEDVSEINQTDEVVTTNPNKNIESFVVPENLLKAIEKIDNRDDLYIIFRGLVDRLKEIDPNSPNVQLGTKMLRIKDMGFVDILEELLDDERTKTQVVKFFGIGGKQ